MQSLPSLKLRRAVTTALVLGAVASLAVRAEPAPSDPPAPAAPTVGPAASTGNHWWSFGDAQDSGDDDEGGIFRLGYWHSTLDVGADGNMQDTQAPGYDDLKYYSYLTEEGVTVRNQGFYVIDPRLLTGDASVRFAFQQARQDASDLTTAQDGNLTDYDFNATLFPELPYTATLNANRSEAVNSQAGGGTTASRSTNERATFFWRETSFLRDREIAPYFSASLQAANEHLEETTTNAGRQFRRDEQRKRIDFDGHNGFETGDLTFNLQWLDLDNREFPDGSYRSRNADISYSGDFGANLNRHSDSHLNYDDRSGDFSTTTLDFDERFYIEHNPFLSSSYYYAYMSSDSPVGDTRTQRGDAGVQYLPFLNVNTNVDVFVTRIDLDTGRINTVGTYAGVGYDHPLPGGGQLSTSVSGGLQIADSQLQSAQVPVINARYQAPPQLGAGAGFVLNERDVLAQTIVVVDVRGGARLQCEEGVDYQVVVEGNQTTIIPLPTSAVILASDPLEVSYLYQVDPSLKSRTGTQSYYVSADWQWIAVALTHDVTRQTPLSGQQQTLLADQDRTSLRVSLRHEWDVWRARADGAGTRYRDERLMYDEVRLSESLWWTPVYSFQMGLDASQSRSNFLLSNRRSNYEDARLTATWHSVQGWWFDGYVSYRTMDDTELLTENVKEAFFRVRRNWPQLTLAFAVGAGQRERGDIQTNYQNVHLSLTRVF